jgi:hypothetical protein
VRPACGLRWTACAMSKHRAAATAKPTWTEVTGRCHALTGYCRVSRFSSAPATSRSTASSRASAAVSDSVAPLTATS